MIDIGGSLLPDWAWYQWAAVAGIALLIGFAGLLVYAVFFGRPGDTYMVPTGEDAVLFWREIMNRRAELRGRITRRMIFYLFAALSFLGLAGGVIWFAW